MKTVLNILKLEKVVLICGCILLINFSIISCNKAEVIPAKTRHGANIFAYKVAGRFAGVAFKTDKNKIEFSDSVIHIEHYSILNKLHTQIERTLVLILNYDVDNQIYVLGNAIFYLSQYDQLDTLYLNESNYLDVTYFSPENRIISGEFDLNFAELDSIYHADTLWKVEVRNEVDLTKGRFDIRYN